ncbi:golvesin C-terminal-like domain-containing protein [Neorhodopirellula lusitana]|uniref:golvesin C-terminal-like domain-containing protein n=1 Tax=Neorhodopirellula lusitana TaxID=445327 RepID=UPI00384F17A2
MDYTSVYVTTEGLLQFGSTTDIYDASNSIAEFLEQTRITALWDDLNFSQAGDDIFVDETVAGEVTVRWNASLESDDSDVQFAVTLFDTGAIEFHYGDGNLGLTPTIGISRGDGNSFFLSSYDTLATLTDANSVSIAPAVPGIVDLGALEFTGSTLDVTGPKVIASMPAGIHSSTTAALMSILTMVFDEPLNPFDANAVANYELRDSGSDLILGNLDDNFYALNPNYISGSTEVALNLSSSLPLGDYRLTVTGASLRDLSGNELDGDGNGSSGVDYVRDFTQIINTPPVAQDDAVITQQNVPVTINVLDTHGSGIDFDANGDPLTIDSTTQPMHGTVTIDSASTVTYTPDPGFNGEDDFQYVVSDGNGGTATATVFVSVDSLGTIVLDNLSSEFEIESGSWGTQTSIPGFFGSDYRFAINRIKTARFTPTIDVAGTFEVFANWTSHPNRATNAPFEVVHEGGTTLVTIDQTQNGGVFQSLGTFTFAAGQSGSIAITTAGANGYVIADAVRLVPFVATTIEIDNSDPAFAIESGTWSTSTSVSGFVGTNYRSANGGSETARFTPIIIESGQYEVFAIWTSSSSHATNAPVEIVHQSGTTQLSVDRHKMVGSSSLWERLPLLRAKVIRSQSRQIEPMAT